MNKFWRANAQHIDYSGTVLYTSKLLKDYILNVFTTKRNGYYVM